MIIFKKKRFGNVMEYICLLLMLPTIIFSHACIHTHVNIVNQDTSKLYINISKWDT